jgi:hypothetical protein
VQIICKEEAWDITVVRFHYVQLHHYRLSGLKYVNIVDLLVIPIPEADARIAVPLFHPRRNQNHQN